MKCTFLTLNWSVCKLFTQFVSKLHVYIYYILLLSLLKKGIYYCNFCLISKEMNLEIPPKKLIIFTLSTIQLFYTLQALHIYFYLKLRKIQFNSLLENLSMEIFFVPGPSWKNYLYYFTSSRPLLSRKNKEFFFSLSSDKWW